MIDGSTGQITGYKTTKGGADTVFPFNAGNAQEVLEAIRYVYTGSNGTKTYTVSIGDLDANKVYYFLIQPLYTATTAPYVSSISEGGTYTTIPMTGSLIFSPRFIRVENTTSVVFKTVLVPDNSGVNTFIFTISK